MTMLKMPPVGGNSHAPAINDFNRQLRQQPWYQGWFQQQGLDPNNVRLSKGQRQQLEQVILQQGGVPQNAFNDMMIDPAGNLNTEHGFASQPSWLKALEIGGAGAAGGFFAAPVVAGAGSGGYAGMGSLKGMIPSLLQEAPAAGGKSGWATLGSLLGGPIGQQAIQAGVGLYSQHAQNSANDKAMQMEQKAAADALAYAKFRDAQSRQDQLDAEQKNLGLYREQEARREPYRQFGMASLSQLMRPRAGG